MYRVLIADDEELARLRMRKLLQPYSDKIEVVGEANDGLEALSKIQSLNPDIVFLDIQMPGMTGIEVLSKLDPDQMPWVVFATAFDEYAIKAFEENAIDYLLKPIESDRLENTIAKIDRMVEKKANPQLLETIRQLVGSQQVGSTSPYLQRIQVKIGDRTILVSVENAIRFESEDKYTTLYTDDARYVIDSPLIELEKKLDPDKFMRVHRAHLVNISRIKEIQRQFGGRLKILINDKQKSSLPVSRNFADKVRKL